MVKCNQLCEWNHYKLGCTKPLHVECPSETVFSNVGVANEEPMTNGDRVRDMCDEELADWLTYFDRCEHCACEGHCTSKCIGGIKEWLKQPAEEGEND